MERHFIFARMSSSPEVTVVNLRCEYRTEPLGVDVPHPRLSWELDAGAASVRGIRQGAYQIQAATSREALASGRADLWDTGKVASEQTNQVPYEGKPLGPGQECWWQVRSYDLAGGLLGVSTPSRWTAGLLEGANWKASWIGLQIPEVTPPTGRPAVYFRHTFEAAKPVRRALVFGSAMGHFELHLNGRRVGEDYFTPGYTDYQRTLYYNTYDVTALLQDGRNAIGGILADGWHSGAIGWKLSRNTHGCQTLFSAQLEIEYEDGTHQRVVTNGNWRVSLGPILETDHLGGCIYDAQKELPGWDTACFDDAGWEPAGLSKKPLPALSAYPSEPVRKTQELIPQAITEPQPGVFLFDLGQNMVGWARLKLKGAPGQQITVRHGEMLNDDGTLYTANLRLARCTDIYFLKGTAAGEVLEPSFTFHGFRYVEVTGLDSGASPTPEMVTGIVVHSDLARTGSFECSHPMVNQLFSNIYWGMRGNYLEVPTDCPQRDERLGWTGDAQVFIRTGACMMDVAPFFTKWMVDMEDAQREDGAFADVAPRVGWLLNNGGTAGWGDAGVICPWTVYQVYGDRRILERHYDAMALWIEYLKNNSKDLIRPASGYADWLAPFGETPKDLIGTAFFAHATDLMAQTARVLGKTAEAENYEALAAEIRTAFNKAFVSPDGFVQGDTQTAYILCLRFRLVPEALRPVLAERLVGQIEKSNWHLGTGFLGVNLLMPTLTEIGRNDVACRLLENTTYPSWGYSIVNGATTIWERWNSYTKENGFGDVSMNSFNHYAYGSVGEWMFSTLAGIDTDGPGFRRMVIRPRPGGSITSAKASYHSINGVIATDWHLDGAKFHLKITIPCNTRATVYVPTKSAESVREGGKPLSKTGDVRFLRMEVNAAVCEVGSGCYLFEAEC